MSLIDSPYQFGIDFSAVPAIPEDRKARQPYLNSFRALLKEEREKIKLWHRAGAGGREVVQAHTGLIDELIKRVVRSLADLPPYSGGSALENFALAAVGGYGRGELNPHSDIDLLFILKNHVDDSTNPFIQDFISILWGIDLDVGHGCRRPMDCLNLAKEDFTVQTAMIDMRLLIGNQLLFEELNQSLGKDVLTKNMEKFLSGKL
ncbi:MAG: nucleotidyltransferase domain-containing protein, partial [Nitrospinales bacterium]